MTCFTNSSFKVYNNLSLRETRPEVYNIRISRNWELLTVIRTHIYIHTAFQEDLKYSDFFRDHLPQLIGEVRREFIFYGLEMGLGKQT